MVHSGDIVNKYSNRHCFIWQRINSAYKNIKLSGDVMDFINLLFFAKVYIFRLVYCSYIII